MKPYLRSVREKLTRKHMEVLIECIPLLAAIIDIEKVDYARGRLATHRERFLVWYLDGRCWSIIVMPANGSPMGGSVTINRYPEGDEPKVKS